MLLVKNQIINLKILKLFTGGIHSELIKKNPHKKFTLVVPIIYNHPPNLLALCHTSHSLKLEVPLIPNQSYYFHPNFLITHSPNSTAGIFDNKISWKTWSYQHSAKWGKMCWNDNSMISSYTCHMCIIHLSLTIKVHTNQSNKWIA